LLSKITTVDLSNGYFRWLTGKCIEAAGVPLRALRVNYVGELGWELHAPVAQLETLYDAVWAAGEEFGIVDFGAYAVNSLRMEKAYRGWGTDMTNEMTMIETGMERFVKFDKGDFVGREALLRRKEEGIATKLVYVEVDADDADVYGGEPVYYGEKVIGVTTSGAYGYAVDKSLAFAYVNPEFAEPDSAFDFEILGKRCQAKVLARPAYDPSNKRLRS
jgi:dimethylglycine dehydrogenase